MSLVDGLTRITAKTNLGYDLPEDPIQIIIILWGNVTLNHH